MNAEGVAARCAAWFEIPTTDLDRASRFNESLLGISLERFAGPICIGRSFRMKRNPFGAP
jgi:predicted enzyme related to lactoylglutathione lyase